MLSDEEKKAVDKIKTLIQYLNVWKENFTIVPEDVKYLVTILNLIEKKSKEIESLKEKLKTFKIEDENIYLQFGEITEKKRWKDKIESKMKELKKECKNCEFGKFLCKQCFTEKGISILQSLLEKE